MTNEAIVTVTGYIATEPDYAQDKGGSPMLRMRLAWTPRRFDRVTSQWQDQPTCFVWVKCWRRIAENANFCLNKGDPIVVSGTLTVSEYPAKDGTRRTSVDITATSIGHDLSRGISAFRRQRQSDERTAQDAQSGLDPAAAESDRPEDLEVADRGAGDPAEASSAEAGRAGAEPGDAGDLEAGDPETTDPELADEEGELEPASAG
jgi:single-strand DNA-binding protein